jgi:hypothetical protein
LEKILLTKSPPGSKGAQGHSWQAVWYSANTQHDTAGDPPCWKCQQKLWRQAANRGNFPGWGYSILQRMGLLYKFNHTNLAVSSGLYHILIPWLPNVPIVLGVSHMHMSCHACSCGPGWTCPPGVHCLCERHKYSLPPRSTTRKTRLS